MFRNRSLFPLVISAGILAWLLHIGVNAQVAPNAVSTRIDLMPQFFSDEVVKGSPVAATITTKTVQQLVDGNRIVHEDVTRVVRDSEGRVRRETATNDSQSHATYSISDPVAGTSVTVNELAKTVFKQPSFPGIVNFGVSAVPVRADTITISSGTATISEGAQEPVLPAIGGQTQSAPISIDRKPDAPASDATVASGGHRVTARDGLSPGLRGGAQTSVQPLGKDTINGVRVEGTLYTTIYPAGALGNEKPIIVEKRSWFSPELRIMVRSEETDPRFGTITYEARITSTEEPDVSLFDIPSDYKIVEPGMFRARPVRP